MFGLKNQPRSHAPLGQVGGATGADPRSLPARPGGCFLLTKTHVFSWKLLVHVAFKKCLLQLHVHKYVQLGKIFRNSIRATRRNFPLQKNLGRTKLEAWTIRLKVWKNLWRALDSDLEIHTTPLGLVPGESHRDGRATGGKPQRGILHVVWSFFLVTLFVLFLYVSICWLFFFSPFFHSTSQNVTDI